MTRPGSTAWFARHESRLAWRDWLSLFLGKRRWSGVSVLFGLLAYALFMHGLAWLLLDAAAGSDRPRVPLIVTGTLILAWSLMLSQATESVTRAFYARGDLELIMTSPAAVGRLFAVRLLTITLTVLGMALALAGPFLNVLAWRDGPGWLGGYGVAAALAMLAVAVAVVLIVGLFRVIGPRRTRGAAQIAAAVMGAGFAIVLQFAAIMSYGTIPGTMARRFAPLARFAPEEGSLFWWPAHAVMGQPAALAVVLGLGVLALFTAIALFAPRFPPLVLAVSGETFLTGRRRRDLRFRAASPAAALRRKEWTLLWRDPWLMSQTLMQLLYLLPAGFILWRDFRNNGGATLLVSVLVVAAGQLGGGLAWLAVSGEDAPDLIAAAPVSPTTVLRARTEAVLGLIACVFGPFVAALALLSVAGAAVAAVGIALAAGSATAIQYWFRAQGRRSLFRRRQTSSRIATIAEAVSSTGWAGAAALTASGSGLAVMPVVIVIAVLAGVWLIRPAGGR